MNKYKWTSNVLINRTEALSEIDFLNEIKKLDNFRVRKDFKFTFFPYEIEDFNFNMELYDYFNGKLNIINDKNFKVFSIKTPTHLELFLKHTKRDKIENAIILSIAVIWITKETQRDVIEQYIYAIFR